MYRSIEAKIWTDEKFRKLKPEEKLLFFYLITNPHAHVSGIYYLPCLLISHETGLNNKELEWGIDTLSKGYLSLYNRDFEIVWVVNMLKHQGRGAKMTVSVASQLEALPKCPLILDFLNYYKDLKIPYRYPIDTLSKGYRELPVPVPVPVRERGEGGEREGKDEEAGGEGQEAKGGGLPAQALLLAQSLATWISQNFPATNPPTKATLKKWAEEADRINRIDGHSWEEIFELLDWCQANSFWKGNILSMAKFRKQWNQLIAKRQAEREKPINNNSHRPTGKDVFKALSGPLSKEGK